MWLAVGAAIIVVAFVAGFWPQHRQLTTFQATVVTLQAQLGAAAGCLRLAAGTHYGEAANLSSAYFDAVRQEAARADGETRGVLDGLLKSRDQVTTSIASTDPGLDVTLRLHERQLRRALGYPISDAS